MNENSKKENKIDLFQLLADELAPRIVAIQNSFIQLPVKENEQEIFFNTGEACEFLRITEPTLRKYVRAGRIQKFVRGQRGNFYKKSSLIKFLENVQK